MNGLLELVERPDSCVKVCEHEIPKDQAGIGAHGYML